MATCSFRKRSARGFAGGPDQIETQDQTGALGHLRLFATIFLGVVSDRDAHEAREVGEIAVQYAMWDNVDGSVVLRRPVLNYSVSYDLIRWKAWQAKHA